MWVVWREGRYCECEGTERSRGCRPLYKFPFLPHVERYHLGLLSRRGMYGPDAKLSVPGQQMQDGPVLRGSIWEAWNDTRWRTARDEGCLKEGEE